MNFNDKIAYFIEIQLVQILSASESFGLFDFLAFLLFDFWTFCKGETSNQLVFIFRAKM